MAFGKRSGKDDSERAEDDLEARAAGEQAEDEPEELEGPFDIEDFDDPAVAELARLDLPGVRRLGRRLFAVVFA